MFKVNLKKNYKNKHVQSVIVPRDKFTLDEAINYVKQHFKMTKIDIKPNYYRFRQFHPRPNAKYFTKKLDNGIMLIIDYQSK
jgi:ribosomal protein S15P/S13E